MLRPAANARRSDRPFTRRRTRLLAAAAVTAALTAIGVALLVFPEHEPGTPGPGAAGRLDAPFAGGDWAANIDLNRAGTRVLLRWVARRDGVVRKLYVRVKVEGSECWAGRAGYAAGTGGVLEATTYETLPDGRPDVSRQLANSTVRPCARQRGESIDIPLSIPVRHGQELATVVRNADPSPSANYFSLNFLYERTGLLGANRRNERNPDAPNAVYGLDPRELVGYSEDGGASWQLPGGPYGPEDGRAFLPTYIEEYADGVRRGQPYYYGRALQGQVVMVFPNVPALWTITALGAYVPTTGAADVTLTVDGEQRAVVRLSGTGMLRESIDPVPVEPGSTVRVETTAGPDALPLSALFADAVWSALFGLGSGFRYFLQRDPPLAAPVYPLPMYELVD